MKALSRLKSAINQSSALAGIALIFIAPFANPAFAKASELQTSDQPALVFQINSQSVLQNQNSLNLHQITSNDPLVVKLDQFLTDKSSPLAGHAAEIVTYTNWKRALSISVVESNMCRFTPKYALKGKTMESYNCSGMGGDNFKRYTSYMDWFADLDTLLSKPNYANRPIEKFIGYYVVPGSSNWLYGVKKTEKALSDMENDAQVERLAVTTSTELAYSAK